MSEARGKVVIITGGAGGIGRAICQALLADGMRVAVMDNNKESVEQFVAEMQETYSEKSILAIVGDRLIVPCGAQLPAFLSLKTGELRWKTPRQVAPSWSTPALLSGPRGARPASPSPFNRFLPASAILLPLPLLGHSLSSWFCSR